MKGDNGDFWVKKIGRNREHDEEINRELKALGWVVIRFWGDDIKKKTDKCVGVIEEVVNGR